MPEKAFIAIGSNIKPETYLRLSIARLAELGKLVALSRVYQSSAVGPTPQPEFLNAAALVTTPLPPLEIRRRLRAIETSLGRVRNADRFAPRTIDLDLCLYGDLVLSTPELTIPSPEVPLRAYLAVTLAELAPDFPHPITGEALGVLAARVRRGAMLTRRPDVALSLP